MLTSKITTLNRERILNEYKIRNIKLYIVIIFFISPFISLLVAIKSYRSPWAKNVIWFFVAFYGYTLVISNEEMDANRYREWFYEMGQANISIENFHTIIYNEYTNNVDVLQPLLTFLVSRFTSNPQILFFAFALVFGYFYSRNIWLILNNSGAILKKESIPLIITFAFIIGFWQINGFRMWTAAHVFFFGVVQYLIYKRKAGLVIAISSVFIHFSFVLPSIILFMYLVFKNSVKLYFILFVATFFITELNLEYVREMLNNISPDFFKTRINSYTNEGYSEEVINQLNNRSWHAQYYIKALKWVVIMFMTIIYFKGLRFLQSTNSIFSLYCFTLLFLSIATVVSQLPSGGRFLNVAYLFAIASIVLYLQHFQTERIFKKLFPFLTVALVLYCFVSVRIGFDTIGLVTILGNPFIAVFSNINIALIELIK